MHEILASEARNVGEGVHTIHEDYNGTICQGITNDVDAHVGTCTCTCPDRINQKATLLGGDVAMDFLVETPLIS